MKLVSCIVVLLVCTFAVLVSSVSPSYAADYTPYLLSPTDQSTDVSPDGTTFKWSASTPPNSYEIAISMDASFLSSSVLFTYSTTETSYKISGLPGEKRLYWRVVSIVGSLRYISPAYWFDTLTDGEGFKLVTVTSDNFTTFNTSVWSVDNSYFVGHDTGLSCIRYRYSSYYDYEAYLLGRFTLPSSPAQLKFKYSYGLGWGSEDQLYVEYSEDGSSYTSISTMSGSSLDTSQTGWNTPGPWKTATLDMPADTRGKTIYLRFRAYAYGGYDAFMDDFEIVYKKYERRLTIASDYGNPTPSGQQIYISGDSVTCTVEQNAFATGISDRRYYCTGWTGAGSIPTTGVGNVVNVTIFRTSTLTWNWIVEYRVVISSTNSYGNPSPFGTNYYITGTSVTLSTSSVQDVGLLDERYALSNWTGTGSCSGSGPESSMVFKITSPSTLAWVYKKQYALDANSPYGSTGYNPVIGRTWYFDSSIVLATAPDFVDVGSGNGYIWAGYSASSSVLPGQARPVVITVRSPVSITWLWTPAYKLTVNSEHGTVSGTATGWYATGTPVVSSNTLYDSVTSTSRWHCTGWAGVGSTAGGSGTVVPAFNLNAPTTIDWLWEREYYVDLRANAGITEPTAGWFTEGSDVPIMAVPPLDTADTRYTFNRWIGTGVGSYNGTAQAASINIAQSLTQTANWFIEYRVVVIAMNGSLMSDPSGWYFAGSIIPITAIAPAAGTGERWVVSWYGTGSGVADYPAGAFTPATVSASVYSPIVQRVEWKLQFKLTISNPTGYGFCLPDVGEYWFFDGELATGLCKGFEGAVACVGYEASRLGGSPISGSLPYFSFEMEYPTNLVWNWDTRPAEISINWGSAGYLSELSTSPACIVVAEDDDMLVYYSEESNLRRAALHNKAWTTTTVLSNVGVVTYIDAAYENGRVHVVFSRENPSGLVYFVDSYGQVKTDQTASTELLNVSGVRPSIAVLNGTLYISYFDMASASLEVVAGTMNNWTSWTVDTTDGAGFFNSLAVRKHDGMPIIAFAKSGGTKGLYFAEFNGSGWDVTTIRSSFAGWFCSLALDKGGVPSIVYQSLDTPNDASLHIATFDGEAWIDSLVDDTGDTGYNCVIVIDDSGYEHVFYNDKSSLLYSRRTPAGWSKTTLATGGVDTWMDASLYKGKPAAVFSRDGKPTYIDATGEATNGGGTTPETPSGGGGGCFIATAAFGSLSAASVTEMTDIRDTMLASSSASSELANLYYRLSPDAARSASCSPAMLSALRKLLN